MAITGPIRPKKYYDPNVDSPTPPSNQFIAGELAVCSKTGRMWVKWGSHDTGTLVPVVPEFHEDSLIYGPSLAGIRKWVYGVAPGTSAATEVYGYGLKVSGALQVTGGTLFTGPSMSVTTPGVISLISTSVSANSISLNSSKPTLTNNGIAGYTGDQIHWLSVTAGAVGSEFGDQGGPSGAYRLNMKVNGTAISCERVVEANDGLKITDLPGTYLLGTAPSTGLVESRGLTYDQIFLTTADITLVAAGTVYTLVSLTLAAGTWMLKGQATYNNVNVGVGTYSTSIYNSTGSTVLVSGSHSTPTQATNRVHTELTAVVVLSVSSVIQLRGVSAIANQAATYQSATGDPNATGLVAVRLA